MTDSTLTGTSPGSIPLTSPAKPSPLNPSPSGNGNAPTSTLSASRPAELLNNASSSQDGTSAAAADPTRRSSAQSPPIDPSKLNHTPAPIPIPANDDPEGLAAGGAGAGLTSPPLRDATTESNSSSAYLDGGMPIEPASHPTVAETGSLSKSPSTGEGPGPKSGQLERREKKTGEGIIKLGSFGGEGLVAKPPPGLKAGDDEAIE
jgi:hypothetical protein